MSLDTAADSGQRSTQEEELLMMMLTQVVK
jgi:hypothetical protein